MKSRMKAMIIIILAVVLPVLAIVVSLKDSAKPDTKTEAKRSSPEKSLQEVTAELRIKSETDRKSQEWQWADQGYTEKLIESYRSLPETKREERQHLIDTLRVAAKDRKHWPTTFNDAKLKELIGFLKSILAKSEEAGPSSILAVNVLTDFGKKIPDYSVAIENVIIQYYHQDSRPGPRGDCILALGKLKSTKGFALAEKGATHGNAAISRSSIYALAEYLDSAKRPAAANRLLSVVRAHTPNSALAMKLLAHHGERRVADMVPAFLSENSDPSQIEAATFAIGTLKLKQHRALLNKWLDKVPDQFLRQQIVNVLNQLAV